MYPGFGSQGYCDPSDMLTTMGYRPVGPNTITVGKGRVYGLQRTGSDIDIPGAVTPKMRSKRRVTNNKSEIRCKSQTCPCWENSQTCLHILQTPCQKLEFGQFRGSSNMEFLTWSLECGQLRGLLKTRWMTLWNLFSFLEVSQESVVYLIKVGF